MNGTKKERGLLSGVLILALILLTGVNRCQEDYYFAAQSQISGTGTPTATPTTDGTDTPEPVITGTPTRTPIPTIIGSTVPTVEATATVGVAAFMQPLWVKELQAASATGGPAARMGGTEARQGGSGQSGSVAGGWFGRSYGNEAGDDPLDTDGDGFTDQLENDMGSDPDDPNSIPSVPPVTRLKDRFVGVDDEMDGLSNQEELKLGSNPQNPDTDGDVCPDGSEVFSGSSPLDPKGRPLDVDRDCLSDEYENSIGTNPNDPDTDGDELRDDIEIAIGSDPLRKDTDSDGILDGKEYQLGSDSTRPESDPKVNRGFRITREIGKR